jgi:hypothetical protein
MRLPSCAIKAANHLPHGPSGLAAGLAPVILAGTLFAAAVLPAGTASALPDPDCGTNAGTVTCTFSYTGSGIDWTVPGGVSSLQLTVYGAGGGGFASASPGGSGGIYLATLAGASLSGAEFSIYPGGQGGAMTGGSNAGGGGGDSGTLSGLFSGGGGGASTVALAAGSLPGSLLVVAGGGGGGSGVNASSGGGDGGGSAEGSGTDGHGVPASLAGGGASPSVPGAAGTGGDCATGPTAGSQLQGGTGGSAGTGGGCVGAGGGGGYFGGGGGSIGAGGGGGSAYPDPAAGAQVINDVTVAPDADLTGLTPSTGDGQVVISYQAQVPTSTTVSTSPNPSRYGQDVTLAATVTPGDGGGTITFQDDGNNISDSCTGRPLTLVSGDTYQASCTNPLLPAGTDAITAVYSGDSGYAMSTSTPVSQHVTAASTRLRTWFTETRRGFAVYATLTSGGHGLAGQPVTFTTDPYGGGHTTLCAAATGSTGTASCQLTGAQVRAFERAWGAYTVRYAGNGSYAPASDHDPGVFF